MEDVAAGERDLPGFAQCLLAVRRAQVRERDADCEEGLGEPPPVAAFAEQRGGLPRLLQYLVGLGLKVTGLPRRRVQIAAVLRIDIDRNLGQPLDQPGACVSRG
jgi:hypothetical protein